MTDLMNNTDTAKTRQSWDDQPGNYVQHEAIEREAARAGYVKALEAELKRRREQAAQQSAVIERMAADEEATVMAAVLGRLPGEKIVDAGGSFLIFRRTAVRHYLEAREAFENNPNPVTETRHQTTRQLLALAYTAEGGNGTLDEVLGKVDGLGFLIAEQWVEIWAAREHLLGDLSNGVIVTIANDVRDLAALGHHLDDMGMADLAAPFLPGGAA
jgi:hypothetical protein